MMPRRHLTWHTLVGVGTPINLLKSGSQVVHVKQRRFMHQRYNASSLNLAMNTPAMIMPKLQNHPPHHGLQIRGPPPPMVPYLRQIPLLRPDPCNATHQRNLTSIFRLPIGRFYANYDFSRMHTTRSLSSRAKVIINKEVVSLPARSIMRIKRKTHHIRDVTTLEHRICKSNLPLVFRLLVLWLLSEPALVRDHMAPWVRSPALALG